MLWKWLVCTTVFIFAPEHVSSNDVSTVKISRDLVPCERGWFYFRDKCYRVRGRKYSDRWSWKDTSDRCVAMGGHLVTIRSKEELDFIVSFLLLDIKTNAWIGLEDRMNESQYTWHDGSVVNYRNWKPNEPSGFAAGSEDCVEMLFEPEEGLIGEWNDAICTKYTAYVCQANITKRKISPNPTYCSPDVGGGWKFQQSCYNVIKEKKTWHDAEEHCKKNYNGGHLVTVLDIVVDKFINYILSDLDEELWIGINVKDQFQQQWSSGWYVGYNGLSEDLRGFEEGYCVARNKFKEWNVVQCSKKMVFVCETSKTKPPVLPMPPTGSHCPDGIEGLRDLGGEYCYFIDTKSQMSWYKSNFECGRKGGSLVSIHSKEEMDILGPFIRYTKNALSIGLMRSSVDGEEFVWADGTKMEFENWHDNEPNNVDQKCGEIYTRSLRWNDVHCDEVKGFICSVRKIGLFSSVPNITNALNTPVEIADCSGMYEDMLKCLSRPGSEF